MASTRKHNRFLGGYKGTTYICHSCKKRTRETGEGESSCELCKKCYVTASIENGHSDNHFGAIANCPECKAELAQYGYTPADCDTWCDSDDVDDLGDVPPCSSSL